VPGLVEQHYRERIAQLGTSYMLEGSEEQIASAERILRELADLIAQGIVPDERSIVESVRILEQNPGEVPSKVLGTGAINTPGKTVRAKTIGQKQYLEAIDEHTITFGIGKHRKQILLRIDSSF
jgi:phosphate starvation-inducible PhoH-like protein